MKPQVHHQEPGGLDELSPNPQPYWTAPIGPHPSSSSPTPTEPRAVGGSRTLG